MRGKTSVRGEAGEAGKRAGRLAALDARTLTHM